MGLWGVALIVNGTAIVIDETCVIVHALAAHGADDDPKRFGRCIHNPHSVVIHLGAAFLRVRIKKLDHPSPEYGPVLQTDSQRLGLWFCTQFRPSVDPCKLPESCRWHDFGHMHVGNGGTGSTRGLAGEADGEHAAGSENEALLLTQ